MPDHPSSAYLSSAALVRRRELFRTVKLNAAGWAAVAGLCAAGAATGLATARLASASPWITVPAGTATAFAAVLAADRRKWAGMLTSYSWTDDLTERSRQRQPCSSARASPPSPTPTRRNNPN